MPDEGSDEGMECPGCGMIVDPAELEDNGICKECELPAQEEEENTDVD